MTLRKIKAIGLASVMILGSCAVLNSENQEGAMTDQQTVQSWIERDGEIYGARADERGPIGGGEGYHEIFTDGDHRVASVEALLDALQTADAGEVIFIEPNAELDLTVRVLAEDMTLKLPGGVTLASNRGQDGAPGALIYSDEFDTRPLIEVTGPGARITGLRLRGPDPKRREDLDRLSFGPDGGGHDYYYRFPTSDGVLTTADRLEVDNCEISGWSHAGIFLRRGTGHHIHHNHIHHNQREALGYGVSHDVTESLIEYNLFNYNRHSIAATGRPGSGYEVRHNIFLEAGQSHGIDMHGGRDRNDGTDIAGTWMKVHHNAIFQTESPNKAIGIRGVPEDLADIHHNWFRHYTQPEKAVRTSGNTRIHSNVYGPEAARRRLEIKATPLAAPHFTEDAETGRIASEPGRVELALHNPSEQAVEARFELDSIPEGAARLGPERELAVSLEPGQRITRELEVRLTEPMRAPALLELAVKGVYGGIRVPSDPYTFEMPVEGSHALPYSPEPANREIATHLLEELDTHHVVLDEDADLKAAIRWGRLGDHLAVEAMVDDPTLERRDPLWTGSTFELFGAAASGGEVRQVVLAPAVDDHAAVAFRVQEGEFREAPAVELWQPTREHGYTLRALIPLEYLLPDPEHEAFRLEMQVSWRPSADTDRAYRTLFGSPYAYASPTHYGRMRLVPVAASK